MVNELILKFNLLLIKRCIYKKDNNYYGKKYQSKYRGDKYSDYESKSRLRKYNPNSYDSYETVYAAYSGYAYDPHYRTRGYEPLPYKSGYSRSYEPSYRSEYSGSYEPSYSSDSAP